MTEEYRRSNRLRGREPSHHSDSSGAEKGKLTSSLKGSNSKKLINELAKQLQAAVSSGCATGPNKEFEEPAKDFNSSAGASISSLSSS